MFKTRTTIEYESVFLKHALNCNAVHLFRNKVLFDKPAFRNDLDNTRLALFLAEMIPIRP